MGLVFWTAGCSDEPTAPRAGTDYFPLFTTLYSNIRSTTQLVVSDPASWQELWAVIGASNSDTRTPPKVDFSESEVIVVAMGERKRAGFQIRIEQVTFSETSRNVQVLMTMPAEQCTGAEVITTPADAVVASKTTRPTVFTERIQIRNC